MTEADPFAALENEAKRLDAEEKAKTLFSQARSRLVLGNDSRTVFFATLALKLGLKLDWESPTAWTDGRHIGINPAWFAEQGLPYAKAIVCHEVLHVALKHHTRRGDRDQKQWNIACDLAVNPILREAGLTVPSFALMPGVGEYASIPDTGLSAEAIYALLNKPKPQGDPGDEPAEGEGEGDASSFPGDMGGTQEPGDGSNAAKAQAEAQADIDMAQAEQLAKRKGELPGALGRLVGQSIRPKVDWKEVLREFVTKAVKEEYRWTPPNRRFVHEELYLPSRSGESLGEIAIAVDTSGSIRAEEVASFAGCVEAIVEAYPVTLRVIYCDCQVHHIQEWEPSDGPLRLDAGKDGGGGTSHVPVFEDIASQPDAPTCLICLTDLYTEFPKQKPDYPVLWAVLNGPKNPQAPFGQTLVID